MTIKGKSNKENSVLNLIASCPPGEHAAAPANILVTSNCYGLHSVDISAICCEIGCHFWLHFATCGCQA